MLNSFRGLCKLFDGPELWDAGICSRQDAKNAKLKDFCLGGLCAFARDISTFGCGSAALCSSW
jgi:hypothetical protein